MADQLNPAFLAGLAQLETAGGSKTVGANNLYNIKDFSGKGTRGFDKAEGSNDAYRDYASPDEATQDLLGLLGRKYPAALTAKTSREFAQALKDGGYATDPKYVDKLSSVIDGGKFATVPSATSLSHLSGGQVSDIALDDTLQGVTRQRGKRPQAFDSEGNPVVLTPIEKLGVLRASLGQADGAAAARHDPDAAATLGMQPGVAPSAGIDGFSQAQKVEDAAQAAHAKNEAVTFGEQIGSASLRYTLPGAIVRKMVVEDMGDPVPGFTVDEALFAGKTEDERDQLASAHNQRHLDAILFDQNEMRQAEERVSAHGGWQGFAASALAVMGDPLSYVGPYAAEKSLAVAGISSVRLAAAGRPLASGLVSFGENAVANTAQELITAQAMNERRGPGDLIAASAMAVIPGVMHGVSGWRQGQRLAAAQAAREAVHAQVLQEVALAEKAQANLGPNATVEQVRAEMDRIQTEQITTTVQGNTTRALGADRQFMPDPDEQLRLNELNEKALEVDTEGKPTPAAVKAQEELAGPSRDMSAAIASNVRFADELPTEWTRRTDDLEAQLFERYQTDPKGRTFIAEHMEGAVNVGWLARKEPGVHHLPAFEDLAAGKFKVVADAADILVQKFLPDARVSLGVLNIVEPASGSVLTLKRGLHMIALEPTQSPESALRVVAHEIAHAVFHDNARAIPPGLLKRLMSDKTFTSALIRAGEHDQAKFQRFSEGSANVIGKDGTLTKGDILNSAYAHSFDEWIAEAGTRFIQRDARGANTLGLTTSVLNVLRNAWDKVKEIYNLARGKGWLPDDEASDEFFKRVIDGTLKEADRTKTVAPEYLDAGLTLPSLSTQAIRDPVPQAVEFLPEGTPQQRAEKKLMADLYRKADTWAQRNPLDAAWEKRSQSLADNSLFNVASTGLLMLKSKNPLVRMFAAEALEDAAGVAGHRQSTAAISKELHEKLFIGNSVNDVQGAYAVWARDAGIGRVAGGVDDMFTGKNWGEFNKRIAEEIESRGSNGGRTTGSAHPSVIAAADSLQKAYDRVRLAQVKNKTLGWASLPESSAGYMPHRMSFKKLSQLDDAETAALHDSLMDQFINVEGWDYSFSANLASRYIDTVRARALGGHDAPIGVHQTGAADVIQEALTSAGLTREEVVQQMKKFMAAGPGYTKRRIRLDLNKTYTKADGSEFKLMDLFDTDQLHLLRSQAGRASGEVALARQGIFGKPGLDTLRRAMGLGKDGERALPRELEAFDQVAAEFLHAPFGDAGGKWLDRAMTINSVARLGGIVFNQFAEYINGIAHVGIGGTLGAISSIGRLRGEILALAKGQKVENSLLKSIETFGGKEFGTETYKVQFPFDNPNSHVPSYGHDSITATDRILRGASHLQSKISFWRAIHSAQQRGFAEQIVGKAAAYIKHGGNDIALEQMGISASLVMRLRNDIDEMAKFEGGRTVSFDITKARDIAAAEDFVQAVHRGVSQIIQGTYIGETGKWAHSGFLKMLTQFRTFSITSVEKQWARQRNSRGPAAALGIMVGSMSIAVPIYMARVYLSSIGRADQEAYLEKQLAPFQLTRATLNYIALSGLAPDFLDALTAVAPDAVQEKLGSPTGGRAGATKSAVGNIIAPAAGYVDDVWGALQNLDKPAKVAKILPFSNVPYLVPAINALTGR